MNEVYRLWHRAGLTHIFCSSQSGSASFRPVSHPDPSIGIFINILPEPFLFYWKKLHFPLSVIWTYWELDIDCRSEANHQRLDLWASIQQAKKWSSSQITHWPVAVRTEPRGEIQPNLTPLIELIKRFKPAHLLCFGEPAKQLLQSSTLDFDDFSGVGCSVHFLPGAEDMLPDNKQAKQYAWDIIKKIQI